MSLLAFHSIIHTLYLDPDLDRRPGTLALRIHACNPVHLGRLQSPSEADFYKSMHVADEAYWIADICDNACSKTFE